MPRGYGYNILCGSTPRQPHTFPSYDKFPVWAGWHNSHAAGRYQFEPSTWRSTAAKYKLTDFSPVNQDTGAWNLAITSYHLHTKRSLEVDLIANKLTWVVRSLYNIWPSLNDATFAKRYQEALK